MAAKNGTLELIGRGGVKRVISFYCDDTAGHAVTFSSDGKADANAPNNYYNTVPCVIGDFCLEAATGQTTTTIKINDSPVSVVLNANQIAAVYNRRPLNIPLGAGSKLTMFQVA